MRQAPRSKLAQAFIDLQVCLRARNHGRTPAIAITDARMHEHETPPMDARTHEDKNTFGSALDVEPACIRALYESERVCVGVGALVCLHTYVIGCLCACSGAGGQGGPVRHQRRLLRHARQLAGADRPIHYSH
jgi:hypothetical protein